MMKENKFDELNTILGASHMTIVSIVNVAKMKNKETCEWWNDPLCR